MNGKPRGHITFLIFINILENLLFNVFLNNYWITHTLKFKRIVTNMLFAFLNGWFSTI